MDTENNIILIEKYLTVVRRNLFIKDKDEIIEDLREDIFEKLNGDFSKNNVKNVLESMGNPELLAIKYYTSNKYLIGPQIYDLYLYMTKIALEIGTLVFFILQIVLATIKAYESNINISSLIANAFGSYIALIFQIFVWVTLIFAVFERALTIDVIKDNLHKATDWNISRLKNVSIENNIDRAECITTIVGMPILYVSLVYFRDFTITINDISYHILKQDIMSKTLFLAGICIILGISVQVMLLVKSKWTNSLIIYNLIVELIGIYISYYLIVEQKLFNFLQIPHFAQMSDGIYFWTNVTVVVIAIYTICVSIYKIIKNKNNDK